MYPCNEDSLMCALCETGDMGDMLKVPVLIVEDDVDICLLFKQCLESAGFYSVEIATSIAAARELFDSKRFVIILLDLQLNTVLESGIALAKYMRVKDDMVNIIVITGHCEAASHPGLLDAEINDFLEKPINLRHLKIKMLLWAVRHQRRVAARSYVDSRVYDEKLAVIKEINEQLEVLRGAELGTH